LKPVSRSLSSGDDAAVSASQNRSFEFAMLLTDVPGVLDAKGELVPALTTTQARDMISHGTISGGMIPKIETCLAAIEGGVRAAYIVDGRIAHVILLEVFTEEGVGTELLPGDRKPRE